MGQLLSGVPRWGRRISHINTHGNDGLVHHQVKPNEHILSQIVELIYCVPAI